MEYMPAAILSVFVIMVLTILGLMRETVILRGDVAALSQLITVPPVPTIVGSVLPQVVTQTFPERFSREEDGMRYVSVFLSDSCGGCEHLLKDLGDEIRKGEVDPRHMVLVVAAASSDSHMFQRAEALGCYAVLDSRSALARACEIYTAPAQLLVAMGSGRVIDYKLGGDTQWIKYNLSRSRRDSEGEAVEGASSVGLAS